MKRKLIFCSPIIWRKIYLYTKNPIFKTAEKFIYSRSSTIPKILSNDLLSIYNGKKWNKRYITRWSVGFKFGELTWNKKPAIYKVKQLKKKK